MSCATRSLPIGRAAGATVGPDVLLGHTAVQTRTILHAVAAGHQFVQQGARAAHRGGRAAGPHRGHIHHHGGRLLQPTYQHRCQERRRLRDTGTLHTALAWGAIDQVQTWAFTGPASVPQSCTQLHLPYMYLGLGPQIKPCMGSNTTPRAHGAASRHVRLLPFLTHWDWNRQPHQH
jgi:hypothetical protein